MASKFRQLHYLTAWDMNKGQIEWEKEIISPQKMRVETNVFGSILRMGGGGRERWSFRICISTRPLTPLCRGHLINPFVMEYSFPLPSCVWKHTHLHHNPKLWMSAQSRLTPKKKWKKGEVCSTYSLLVIHSHSSKVMHRELYNPGSCILLGDDQRGVRFNLPCMISHEILKNICQHEALHCITV